MSTSSRNFIVRALAISSLIVYCQTIPLPHVTSPTSISVISINGVTSQYADESAVGIVAEIRQAFALHSPHRDQYRHPRGTAAQKNGDAHNPENTERIVMGGVPQQKVIQSADDSRDISTENELAKTKEDAISKSHNSEISRGSREPEMMEEEEDWHKNQVEAATKGVEARRKEQWSDWYRTRVERAKKAIKDRY